MDANKAPDEILELSIDLPDGEYTLTDNQAGKQAIIVVKGGKVKTRPEYVSIIRAGYPAQP